MRSILPRAFALSAVLALSAGGCSDAVAPREVAGVAQPGAPSHGLISALLEVPVLQRLLPLGQSYSASAVIGTAGGRIAIPQAGFSISFPAGAVSAPVTIRATALAGGNVAYDFEPHGIVFLKDPTITQDLSLTQVVQQLLLASQLQGGYFADDAQLAGGTAAVTETRPATFNLLSFSTSFTVHHFSGYVVAKKGGGYMTTSNDRSSTGAARF